MPLRFIDSPNVDTSQWTPSAEALLSGVQQAQQRHDTSRQVWHETTMEALKKGYISEEGRKKYLQDQQNLWDNVITKNYGNLAAGSGDVINAIELDKANPYHNLNDTQLREAERLKAGIDTYGSENTLIFNNPLEKSLLDEKTGNWVNPNSLVASFTKKDEYATNFEKQMADMAAESRTIEGGLYGANKNITTMEGDKNTQVGSGTNQYFTSVTEAMQYLTPEQIKNNFLNESAYKAFISNNPTALVDYTRSVGGTGKYDPNAPVQQNVFSNFKTWQDWAYGQLEDKQRYSYSRTKDYQSNKAYDYAMELDQWNKKRGIVAGEEAEKSSRTITSKEYTVENKQNIDKKKNSLGLNKFNFDDKGNIATKTRAIIPLFGKDQKHENAQFYDWNIVPQKEIERQTNEINNLKLQFPEYKDLNPKQLIEKVNQYYDSGNTQNVTNFIPGTGFTDIQNKKILENGLIYNSVVKIGNEDYDLKNSDQFDEFASKLTGKSQFWNSKKNLQENLQELLSDPKSKYKISEVNPRTGMVQVNLPSGEALQMEVSSEFKNEFTPYIELENARLSGERYAISKPIKIKNGKAYQDIMLIDFEENKNKQQGDNTTHIYKPLYRRVYLPQDEDGNILESYDLSKSNTEEVKSIFYDEPGKLNKNVTDKSMYDMRYKDKITDYTGYVEESVSTKPANMLDANKSEIINDVE